VRRTLCLCVSVFLSLVAAEAQTPTKTILDGIYSAEQATHGQALYSMLCSGCHGKMLEGVSAPALTDRRFTDRWREGSLDGLYSFIKQRMPFGRPPNFQIPDADYLDIVTYILKMNDYPAGSVALSPSLLNEVMFVGKSGPQPVPDGSLVVTIGCLSRESNGVWMLSAATEPVRAEWKISAQKNWGSLTFRLVDIDAVPDFEPDDHKGHKIQVKGYLTRQPNAERIGLTAIDMLESTCSRQQ
jgi:mono/diheme cytochrome c family protein